MGWFYFFVAEIGSSRTEAENFARHFENLSLTLSNGQRFFCASGFHGEYDNPNNFWVSVIPKKSNEDDLDVFEDGWQMTEITYLLYDRLRTAPTFRYALAGLEIEEFLIYEDLIADGKPAKYEGLVVSEDIWRKTGTSDLYESFSPGYLWIPFPSHLEWIPKNLEPLPNPSDR